VKTMRVMASFIVIVVKSLARALSLMRENMVYRHRVGTVFVFRCVVANMVSEDHRNFLLAYCECELCNIIGLTSI
jgi:hypothetical protein